MPEPTTTEPTTTEPTGGSGAASESTSTTTVDLTKLEGEELNKVLENPNLFKLPRIQEAIEAQKQLKELKKQQDTANEESLTKQKKFEDLANQRGEKITVLEKQIQDNAINSALTVKLHGEQVVDLDAALKLVDKSKLSIDDNGQVQGVDDAIGALKSGKAYLFTTNGNPRVGNPSNPSSPATPGDGRYKFKESQMTPEFFNANKKEILEANRLGLVEADGPPR